MTTCDRCKRTKEIKRAGFGTNNESTGNKARGEVDTERLDLVLTILEPRGDLKFYAVRNSIELCRDCLLEVGTLLNRTLDECFSPPKAVGRYESLL